MRVVFTIPTIGPLWSSSPHGASTLATSSLPIWAPSSGKNLTELLEDLQACHFISRVIPYDKKPSSTLARYEVSDPYVQFFSHAIRPREAGLRVTYSPAIAVRGRDDLGLTTHKGRRPTRCVDLCVLHAAGGRIGVCEGD